MGGRMIPRVCSGSHTVTVVADPPCSAPGYWRRGADADCHDPDGGDPARADRQAGQTKPIPSLFCSDLDRYRTSFSTDRCRDRGE
jgi:hypothetical protein